MLSLVDPDTRKPFPSVVASGRRCYAIPEGAPFAVLVDLGARRAEVVVSVDGRDALSNREARRDLPGVLASGSYLCKGWQVSKGEARAFVCAPSGYGLTTAERSAGEATACGLVACAVWAGTQARVDLPREARPREHHELRGIDLTYREPSPGLGGPQLLGYVDPTRPLVTCSAASVALSAGATASSAAVVTRGSVGAAAGAKVAAVLGDVQPWTRAGAPTVEAVEYDTREAWARRGVLFPALSAGNPWPGDAAQFADEARL